MQKREKSFVNFVVHIWTLTFYHTWVDECQFHVYNRNYHPFMHCTNSDFLITTINLTNKLRYPTNYALHCRGYHTFQAYTTKNCKNSPKFNMLCQVDIMKFYDFIAKISTLWVLQVLEEIWALHLGVYHSMAGDRCWFNPFRSTNSPHHGRTDHEPPSGGRLKLLTTTTNQALL